MRNLYWIAAVVACVLVSGCAGSNPADRAFSKEWVNAREREADYQQRVEDSDERELVLLGKPGKNRAVVQLDDEGKRKLRLGNPSGFHADLDISHGAPDVKLRYRVKW